MIKVTAVCAAIFLLLGQAIASTPVPKVYHYYTVRLMGREFGVSETDRVVRGTHQRIIVPGRQTVLDFSVGFIVLPMSLIQLAVILSGSMSVLLAFLFCRRHNQLAKPSGHDRP